MHLYTPRPDLLSGLQKNPSQRNCIHSFCRPVSIVPQLAPGVTWKRLYKYMHRRLFPRFVLWSYLLPGVIDGSFGLE